MKNKRQPKKSSVERRNKKVLSAKPAPKTKAKTKSKPRTRRALPITPVELSVESVTNTKPHDKPVVRCVPVLIRTKFYSKSLETAQTLQVPMVDKDTIRLDLTINLRMSEAILITPVRRNMEDVKGLISDAESIANDRRN